MQKYTMLPLLLHHGYVALWFNPAPVLNLLPVLSPVGFITFQGYRIVPFQPPLVSPQADS
jgi:hypothetical protein